MVNLEVNSWLTRFYLLELLPLDSEKIWVFCA